MPAAIAEPVKLHRPALPYLVNRNIPADLLALAILCTQKAPVKGLVLNAISASGFLKPVDDSLPFTAKNETENQSRNNHYQRETSHLLNPT